MRNRYLALDMGSTYTKCALLGEDGVLALRQLPTPAPLSPENGERYEIDADAYVRQAESLLWEMRDENTAGILISTQMHGFVLSDARAQPLTPYISWQDRVGESNLHRIVSNLGRDAARASGVPMKANLALCALLGRMQQGFHLPPGAYFHTLGGYLIARLTGRHVCHMTNAAPTGMADVRMGEWNRALMRQAGLEQLVLPRLECGLSPVGRWHGMDVYPDLGDQQACAFGAHPEPENTLCLAVGTSGLMGYLTTQWGDGPYENRPWIWPGAYLRTITGLPGGRDLAAVKSFLSNLVWSITQEPPEEARIWDFLCNAKGRAARPNFSSPWSLATESPESLVLALYEAMAEAYGQAAGRMGALPRRLAFLGGAAGKNAALRRALEARFPGVEATVCGPMEGLYALAKQIDNGGKV